MILNKEMPDARFIDARLLKSKITKSTLREQPQP